MINSDILNQLQQLIKTSAPRLIEATQPTQQSQESSQWSPGDRLQAFVQANLGAGRFQVLIGNNTLDMNLPRNTEPGQTVELRYVGNQPRLTFILANDAHATQDPKQPVSLSDTAKFLGALLEKSSQLGNRGASPLAKAGPVLTGPPPETQKFAQTLQNAISQSGLFYESHQAQWVTGERPLAQLLKEPQAQLSQNNQNLNLQNPNMQNTSVQKEAVQTLLQPPIQENREQQSAQSSTTSIARMHDQTNPVHSDAAPIVRQQLEMLDTRQVLWQGQIWPGQDMNWKIEERDARTGEGDQEREWQTTLTLKMPHLGEVQATLSLTGKGVRINVNAQDGGTVETMKKEQVSLGQNMEAAGLKLLGMAVVNRG